MGSEDEIDLSDGVIWVERNPGRRPAFDPNIEPDDDESVGGYLEPLSPLLGLRTWGE